jgi:methyl-accepting chemotaxis protein
MVDHPPLGARAHAPSRLVVITTTNGTPGDGHPAAYNPAMDENQIGAPAGPAPGARRALPIGFQVMLGLGGLLVLLAACSLVAIFLVLNLQHDETHLNDSDVPYAGAVGAATLNAKGIANDERGFLMTGDPKFMQEAEHRVTDARAAFATALGSAADARQRQAVEKARAGFERWVQVVHGEFEAFQDGDRQGAIAASLGPGRAMRKAYEASLTSAQTLGASSIQSARSSFAVALSRSLWIIVACLLVALAIGVGVSYWLVRSIAMPVYRLAALLGGDAP